MTQPGDEIHRDLTNPNELAAKSISATELCGGHLALVMASTMLRRQADRRRFLELAGKDKGKFDMLRENYHKLYGYFPSEETVEWAEVAKAYETIVFDIPEYWIFNKGLSYFQGDVGVKVTEDINDEEFIFSLLTGLEDFGRNGGGDLCYLSVLPSPLKTTEVYHFDGGILGSCIGYSIADLIANSWGKEEEENDDVGFDSEGVSESIFGVFNKLVEEANEKRPYYHDPEVLFKRTLWVSRHTSGNPVPRFAEKLKSAPTYSAWENEVVLLKTEPALANYWLLAHYFLGNEEACKATIEHAKNSNAEVTRQLAHLVEALLDNPAKNKLGTLGPEELENLKKETRKNCAPEHLEPAVRKTLTAENGDHLVKKLSNSAFQKEVEEERVWCIFENYPEDIDSHDKALKEIAKEDAKLASVIDRYFSERGEGPHNRWPEAVTDEHHQLSLPITAAFCSGLKYDSDHPKAFSGITSSIGKLDDDHAMMASRKAFEVLKKEDDRLEYIIEGLAQSTHPKAQQVMCYGARRFFDYYQTTGMATENEGGQRHVRDDFYEKTNYFRKALKLALSFGTEDSEKLAERVLSVQTGLHVFGQALGSAFRVVGDRKLMRYTGYAKRYCVGTSKLEAKSLDKNGIYNLSEAAIAFAKLSPEEAYESLRVIFNNSYEFHPFELDIKSAALAGLLMLAPDDAELLQWAERILGNRSGEFRVYGVLRGIEEGKVKIAANWARYHVYAAPDPFFDNTPQMIEAAARNAIKAALGETLLPFDGKDKYASLLNNEGLADAILQPWMYPAKNVLEKIVENKVQVPNIVNNAGAYLLESLRYSADEGGRNVGKGRWPAVNALIVQGMASLEMLAKALELEHADPIWYTNILYAMRLVEPEASIFHWLLTAGDDEVLDQLETPSPRFMPWLDLLAAYAFVKNGNQAVGPIGKALEWRYQFVKEGGSSTGWDEEEPTIVRLPKIYMQLGETAIPLLEKKVAELENTFNPKEYINEALESRESLSRRILATPELTENKEMLLFDHIKGEYYSEPEYNVKLILSGKQLSWYCKIEKLYFESLVEGQQLESKRNLEFTDVKEALENAKYILKMLTVLGYMPGG